MGSRMTTISVIVVAAPSSWTGHFFVIDGEYQSERPPIVIHKVLFADLFSGTLKFAAQRRELIEDGPSVG
jgi:hypothetical protein